MLKQNISKPNQLKLRNSQSYVTQKHPRPPLKKKN